MMMLVIAADDAHGETADAVSARALRLHADAGKPERGDSHVEVRARRAGREERAEEHVAARAADAIDVRDPHRGVSLPNACAPSPAASRRAPLVRAESSPACALSLARAVAARPARIRNAAHAAPKPLSMFVTVMP